MSGTISISEIPSYNLTIQLEDGSPSFAMRNLLITVNSANSHAPAFSTAELRSTISETDPIGTYVQNAHATDPDIGAPGTLRYR